MFNLLKKGTMDKVKYMKRYVALKEKVIVRNTKKGEKQRVKGGHRVTWCMTVPTENTTNCTTTYSSDSHMHELSVFALSWVNRDKDLRCLEGGSAEEVSVDHWPRTIEIKLFITSFFVSVTPPFQTPCCPPPTGLLPLCLYPSSLL